MMQEVNMRKRNSAVAFGFIFILLASLALANGLNLNSLGSRALAMGGAFVGLADDFSAIYWNPAGMAFFKTKYFGFYGTDLIPSMTYNFEITPPGLATISLVDAQNKTKHYLGGLAAYYHPVTENLVVGFGIYTPSGLGVTWNGEDFAAISENKAYDWMSKIGVVSISPAVAYKINDMFAVGATFNINYGMFDIKTHAGSAEIPIPPYKVDLGQYEENMTGWGYGATFGVLVKPHETFSLGATFRTATKIKFEGEAIISNLMLLKQNTTSDITREVTWPVWLAFGAAFKPMPNLIVTADYQWTDWKKIDVMETEFKDPYWALMMKMSGDDRRMMEWRSQAQIRFGAEYRLSDSLALRGGYYWDPSPAPDETMNVLLPNFDFNVATFGLGYTVGNLQIDFGFEYLWGKEREVPVDVVKIPIYPYFMIVSRAGYEHAMPGKYKMNLPVPNLSISYKF